MKLKFLLHDEVQRERRASLRKVVAYCYFGALAGIAQAVWLSHSDAPPGSYMAGMEALTLNVTGLAAVGCFAYGTIALVQLIGMGKWDK